MKTEKNELQNNDAMKSAFTERNMPIGCFIGAVGKILTQ
jgi:hypothetical protein